MTDILIDEIDVKILRALIRDARTSLKEIAKDCEVSAVAISKRIKRLKNEGIITGTASFINLKVRAILFFALIGVKVRPLYKSEICQSIQLQSQYGCFRSIGYYDLITGIFAKSMNDLDKKIQFIKDLRGVESVEVNIWLDDPHFTLENLVLQPTGV